MTTPSLGSLAPDFCLPNHAGNLVQLSDFKYKKNVLIYFYPKASTPGCTVQACGMRDQRAEFELLDTQILGVSPDGPPKLQKFLDKYGLNFDLLADEDHSVAEQYGVWGLKKFMGREFMGVVRTSFLIDKDGYIRHLMTKVKTKTHDTDILSILKNGI